VGTGDGGGCNAMLACEAPSSGRVSLCGRLLDAETGARIEAADATGAACDPGAPAADGPCSLQIRMYDPLAFAANPTGTAPLAADSILVDDCGRFAAVNVNRPFNGFVAVAVDDAGAADARVLTGIAFAIEANGRRAELRAFSTLHASDERWTASAGSPFGGSTFADKGVFLPVFLHGATPVPGVTITVGGASSPGNDYYFGDADASLRNSIDASMASSGVNGAGLMVNSNLSLHSGIGSEPAGCEWPTGMAASIPGVVFFREAIAHVEGDPAEPCPEQ
jgi:hypothetical protein